MFAIRCFKKNLVFLLLLIFATRAFLPNHAPLFSQSKKNVPFLVKSRQNDVTTDRALMNVNNIALWLYADGTSGRAPDLSPGIIFPRGTAAVVYQDALIWGGLVRDGAEPALRVGGGTYQVATMPGGIVTRGIPEDTTDSEQVNRIWKIRRHFWHDLKREAAEFFAVGEENVTAAQEQQLADRYRRDWLEWPVYKGAPFYDADGDGIYSPQFDYYGSPVLYPDADEPGIADADMVIYFVTNDLDEKTTENFACSRSIGLEIQTTVWGYLRGEPLNDIIFKRHRFIYEGTANTLINARIDSLYIGQWSDPDIGNAGDDFVGCDILLNLAFAYNSRNIDSPFQKFDLTPPAFGYDLLAGPIEPKAHAEAIFDQKKRKDFKNLPFSSFVYFAAGSNDVDLFPECYGITQQWWNTLRGFRPRPEFPPSPWVTPEGVPTKLALSGDPVLGTGWVDSNPGDRRFVAGSGPFTLSFGDTNEIYIALIGGSSSDRLASISAMKFYSRYAQQFFENLFEFPAAPPQPAVHASEYDGKIVLTWNATQEEVSRVELYDKGGFKFEGYNVYQLPINSFYIADAVKIATYDLVNEVTTIVQEEFDQASGVLLNRVVQTGTNSGIYRSINIDRDLLQSTYHPLINGQEYKFAVTAYSYNPDRLAAIPSLESNPAIVTVIPQSTKPGQEFPVAAGDTIPVTHVQGISEGSVAPVVVDPLQITGDEYKVVFVERQVNCGSRGCDDEIVWFLLNQTSGDTLLKNQVNQSGEGDYQIVDGLKVVVANPPLTFTSFAVVANAAGLLDPPEAGAFAFNNSGFPVPANAPGVDRPTPNQQTNGSIWGIHTSSTNIDFATFVSRVARNGLDRAVPYDFEMRFTAGPNYGNWWYTDMITRKIPFELWNIGIGTPDDPGDDYRMLPLILPNIDSEDVHVWQVEPIDHAISDGTDDPYTPRTYWVQPSDTSPGTAGYDAAVAEGLGMPVDFGYLGSEAVMARIVLVNLDGGDVNDPTFPANVNALVPEQGTVFRITTSKTNAPGDVFTFSTSAYAPTFSLEQAKKDVMAQLNVFPNPYYGIFNPGSDQRFVTFSHLPQKAIIRIFNLAGVLVRTLRKDSASQFHTWDLLNEFERLVGNGIYIAYIEMPELRVSKTLKLVIVHN